MKENKTDKKPLRDWTLGEAKETCENHKRCNDCPLLGFICADADDQTRIPYDYWFGEG